MLDLLQHYFGVNNCYLKYSSLVIPTWIQRKKMWISVSHTGITTYRYWDNKRGIL
ncbi:MULTISPECIES: hypothetical protein [Wolbachia]|uniref:hypothetical protein n=1 Tax=Wolbachia TaxID=953 RepID=UPI0016510114|nr:MULTISPECIES: hypothetical protein [Wolbachia]MBC6686201.1 hypothetical protein [Wolbachia pipientis]MDR0773333.1 hypothetical protein [Wolbachia pipientis]QTP62676.1 hypothetical protein HUB95_00740 [Wolbachia endosymbiont of Ceratosolen solmsi]UVW84048.1 hypothetical protein NHG98_00820 [Wolbachia endosymbiont of Aedes albopictus]WMT84014.1 hypothetical protein NMD99_04980 [Wolbachia endosymbiont of Listronotus oregonensis]